MHAKNEELQHKLNETKELLEAMIMELRFRGCDDQHKLIRRAQEMSRWLKKSNP
ncbi:hypothetical protein [Desulfosediminicola flagellatus]|uniref:hypothetical protein n=1 Tax=Desulfosediminicola flagellatus TaxID=2569541 RepID=UPI0012947C75|nr:hypothetical protein [Desulfosediminicola flagellatus]